MRNIRFTKVLVVFLLSIGMTVLKVDAQKSSEFPFYVGTYTKAESKGIYKYVLLDDGSLEKAGLVATSDNPSFLAKSRNGKYLLAVNEIKNEQEVGHVESFLIEDNSLKLLGKRPSGGAYPCFITISNAGHVLVANYGDGTVGLLKLERKGELTGPLDIQRHVGSGASSRQQGPHAHSVWFGATQRDVISVDLGTNELWFSQIDLKNNKLTPATPPKLAMSEGAGPRHMTFHPNGQWAYVLNELNSTMTVLMKNEEGVYEKGATLTTLPSNFEGKNSTADIHISSDGAFIYASNRGHDSLAIYQVNAEDGSVRLIGHESTRGEVPRNFSLSPDDRFVLVANQKTNTIVSFRRDENTGALTHIDQIEAPTPVCILF